VLQDLYPEHDWKVWKFSKVPAGYWNQVKNQRELFESLAQEFKLHTPQDWSKISVVDLRQKGAGTVLDMYRSLEAGTNIVVEIILRIQYIKEFLCSS
jgi:hypothetical protein